MGYRRQILLEDLQAFMPQQPNPSLSLTASSKTGMANERRHVNYENCSGKVPSRRMAWNWDPDRETTATT